jgi:hypothetical protein
MKKILLLIIILPIGTWADSQNLFPESDAIWNVHLYVNDYLFTEYIYGLSGDTIINDNKYSKMYLLNDTTLNMDENDLFLGGIRAANKQVWFLYLNPESSEKWEYLLYDFSKSAGESVNQEIPLYAPNMYYLAMRGGESLSRIIVAIEETLNGKTFLFDTGHEWIEGIGSINGLFWDYYAVPTDGQNYRFQLACFKQSDEVKYLNNSESNTCFCSGSAGLSEITNTFSVFPDKQTSSIKIISNRNYPSSCFELFDLQGQRLIEEPLHSLYQTIPCNNLNRGLYIYRIKDLTGIFQAGKILLE